MLFVLLVLRSFLSVELLPEGFHCWLGEKIGSMDVVSVLVCVSLFVTMISTYSPCTGNVPLFYKMLLVTFFLHLSKNNNKNKKKAICSTMHNKVKIE